MKGHWSDPSEQILVRCCTDGSNLPIKVTGQPELLFYLVNGGQFTRHATLLMTDIPTFTRYGVNDPNVEGRLKPRVPLRHWHELNSSDKTIALQELKNRNWLNEYSREACRAVAYLNHHYLDRLPGKRLHASPIDEDYIVLEAGTADFEDIFCNHESEDMVFRMLSVFAENHIDESWLETARQEKDPASREQAVNEAYAKFDRLANCLNHIFEQFNVNIMVTRYGVVPRQDKRIETDIYEPTLQVLSDPKWEALNSDLALMFEDYHSQNYGEVITKAHTVVHRFLQIAVGDDGKNRKGELGKLLAQAKREGAISDHRFSELIVSAIHRFFSSERAASSTAKPAHKIAGSSDALLAMNVLMVFLQHCLQHRAASSE